MSGARRKFQRKVSERGQALRQLTNDRLIAMNDAAPEPVRIGRRAGTIATFCKELDGGRIAVVLRGELQTWIPGVKSVARDGFFKHRDGTVGEMPFDEIYDYDHLFHT